MKKIVDYILSVIFFLSFGLLLLIFHPIQWLCLRIGGYAAHKRSVDLLNGGLVGTYALLGNVVRFVNKHELPSNRPIIFVANHQSMFDIPPLIWFLRKYHAKFISKIELTKGIPSVSFNLKYGGGANIDRKDPKQAVAAILQLAARMKENNWSAVIFPEGTRSKDGKLKAFNVGGIATILKKVPHALIVPIAIHNSWRMQRNGGFPLDTFNRMIWEVLEPIEPEKKGAEALVVEAEQNIRRALGQ
jgi:1-acyl-sn-glycerol-3-phosphate acyltransferase